MTCYAAENDALNAINRSIDFEIADEVPVGELKQCIGLALTYHRNKKLSSTERWKMVAKVS